MRRLAKSLIHSGGTKMKYMGLSGFVFYRKGEK